MDILREANWSSEGTFQAFYHHKEDSSCSAVLRVSVLASAATFLHIYRAFQNVQLAQDINCLHAIQDYTRKVKLKYQHIHPPHPTV